MPMSVAARMLYQPEMSVCEEGACGYVDVITRFPLRRKEGTNSVVVTLVTERWAAAQTSPNAVQQV